MKKVSRKTIVNRIKNGKYICPICGCTHSTFCHHYVEYPEIYEETFCSNCSALLAFADNSPYYEVCDIIREELKHITYKECVRIVNEFKQVF